MLLYLCVLLCKQQFGVLTVKFLLNQITTHKKNHFRKYCHILQLSRWSPLGPKRWPICKVLSRASQSSFSPSFLVPFIKPTFWTSSFKILVEPHYKGNDDQFAKYCQTPRNHRSQEVFCCWLSVRHFAYLSVNSRQNPLWPKIWPISKTQSQAFYSPFSAGLFVRIM